MKKFVMSFAAVAAMLLLASCGNKSTNNAAEGEGEAEATPAEVAYETFTVEKYNASFELPQGMRRTVDPVMDNGGCWTLVPEDDNDWPIYAAVDFGVYESSWGDYDDERIQREFDEDIPEEAEKTLDLEKKEYTYSVLSTEEDGINEFHRVLFKGNQSINVTISYTKRWEDKLGGDIRDHILKSAKFN